MNQYIITEMQVKTLLVLMNRDCEMDEDEFLAIGKELRSHPYQSERDRGCLTCYEPDCDILKTADQLCWKSMEQHDKQVRDKVLDELLVILEKLSNKDRTAYIPANVEKTTIERIIDIVKELRAGEQ
jgi:hypothetical protein